MLMLVTGIPSCGGVFSMCRADLGDGWLDGNVEIYSKNRATVQYCISVGFSGFQYLMINFVDIVPS